MSRHGRAVLQVTLLLAALSLGLALAPAAVGQEKKAAKLSVHEKLALEIETRDFADPIPLKDFLPFLCKKCADQGAELAILVDINAFKDENPENGNGPYEDEIRLPSAPKTMTVAQALQLAISQIRTDNGAFIVQNGWIVILTRTRASLEARLQERVVAHFEKTPFTEVVKRLADLTGATILIDPRLQEKAQAPITADLTGNVALAAVLPAIADMADLRVVRIAVDAGRAPRRPEAAAMADTRTVATRSSAQAAIQDMADPRVVEECLYVTTPTNADALEKRLRARKEEEMKEKERKSIGGLGDVMGMGGILGNPGGQGKTVAPELAQLQAEIATLRAEVARLRQLTTESKKAPKKPLEKP